MMADEKGLEEIVLTFCAIEMRENGRRCTAWNGLLGLGHVPVILLSP